MPLLLCLLTPGGYGVSILRGIRRYLRERPGCEVILTSPGQDSFEEMLVKRPWAGCILQLGEVAAGKVLLRRGIPVVNVSNSLLKQPFPQVVNDEKAVGEMAAEHFLDRGFTHFGYYGFQGHAYAEQRGQSFLARLRRDSMDAVAFDPSGLREDRSQLPERRPKLEAWVADLPKPVGIMACNDHAALHVIRACQAVGISIPDDVAVLGVDNDEMECELSEVPISSIQLNGERIGWEAASLLQGLMKGAPPPSQAVRVAPVEVVTRQSTDVLAMTDPVASQALKFIRENGSRPLSVDDVITHVGVSRRSLEQRFRKVTRRTIYHEIQREHVGRAKEMLAHSNRTATEIAEASGFVDGRSLSIVFRKLTGETPTQYRRRMQRTGE